MKQYDLPVLTDAQAAAALDTAVEQVRVNLPLYTFAARTIPACKTSTLPATTTSGPAASGPAKSG